MTANTRKIQKLSLVGGRLCLDFVNTVSWRQAENPKDLLQSFEDLVTWAVHAHLIDPGKSPKLLARAAANPAGAQEALSRAKTARETIASVYGALANSESPREKDLSALSELLRRAMSVARIAASPDGFEIEFDPEPSMDQVLSPVVWSAVELLREPARARVKECSGATCGWLFVDTSKNHSRKWCEMRDCGNREKARRHYSKVRKT
jgi:predicted RNA-binding Zn ribbon-like protein